MKATNKFRNLTNMISSALMATKRFKAPEGPLSKPGDSTYRRAGI
jgi:hypothetical protein